MTGQVENERLILTIILGGSTDNAVAEVNVAPLRSSQDTAVITEFAPATWRTAAFRSYEVAGTAEFSRKEAATFILNPL